MMGSLLLLFISFFLFVVVVVVVVFVYVLFVVVGVFFFFFFGGGGGGWGGVIFGHDYRTIAGHVHLFVYACCCVFIAAVCSYIHVKPVSHTPTHLSIAQNEYNCSFLTIFKRCQSYSRIIKGFKCKF